MSSTVSRRDFLTAGATLAGGALLGGVAGCATDGPVAPAAMPPLDDAAADDLAEMAAIRSSGGLLAATIAIATHPVLVADRPRFAPVTYGSTLPGPCLLVNAGDSVDLTFRNRIAQGDSATRPGYGRPPRPADTVTNVHFHGLHVTPTGTGDNMLVMIEAGASFRYQFDVAAAHPAGLFWYHPHVHGLVTNQLSRGACGLIYIDNAHSRSQAATYRRRLMVLQQLYLDADLRTLTYDDAEREDPMRALTLINGERMPQLRMRRGERQIWAIANGSSSAFYQLRFPPEVDVRVLAYDGLTRSGYAGGSGPTIQIAPGKRVELDVLAPPHAMTGTLALDAYFQGVDTWPAKPIGTIAIGGAPMADPGPVPLDSAALPDLGGESVARSRTIIFDQDDTVAEGEFGRFRMYLEGTDPHSWNPEVPEWTGSVLGSVEEWTVVNATVQEHPFHVHVNPVQVMSVIGSYNSGDAPAVLTTGYHDTVVVPPMGRVVVRTRFTDFVGAPILMHCHILDHEDMGMMTWFSIQ